MYEGKERDFETEQDASTLKSAHEIRSDSKRHAKAMKHLKTAGKAHKAAHEHEAEFAQTRKSQASATNGRGSKGEVQGEEVANEGSY